MAEHDGKTRHRMNEREWQCFEDGVTWERQRIIKSLDGLYVETLEIYGVFLGKYKLDALNEAVALIKGEK
jgi:hypothetical protein